jgi:hypothetical protein
MILAKFTKWRLRVDKHHYERQVVFDDVRDGNCKLMGHGKPLIVSSVAGDKEGPGITGIG